MSVSYTHLDVYKRQDYERSQEMGSELKDDYYEEVMEINLYDSYSYADEFTKKELEDVYKRQDISRCRL